MRRIGLTGGIGSGKSTVAARLAELGAVVIDADALAREVVVAGTPGFEQVVAHFGPEVLGPDGELDRAALGRLVFADEQALADLNSIVHPLVAERTAALMARAGADDVLVYDVPLLAENELQGDFDAVIVVEASEEIRLRRLARRGLPEHDARARMARQASDERRRSIATVVLDNRGSPE
ncbi:MAG TPA: dephospho-CoA kinase, partial [Jatrophihabitans sp.]